MKTLIILLALFTICGVVMADDQYVCLEHGFVETENLTFHGLDFPICEVCLEIIIRNNSDTFARLFEEAWRGK